MVWAINCGREQVKRVSLYSTWGQASHEARIAICWLIQGEKEWGKGFFFFSSADYESPLTALSLGISSSSIHWEQVVRITLLFIADAPSGPRAGFPHPLLVLRRESPAPWRTTNFCIPQLPLSVGPTKSWSKPFCSLARGEPAEQLLQLVNI